MILSNLLQLVPISDPNTALLRPKSSELSLGSLESLVADDGLDGRDLRKELEHGGEMSEGGEDDGKGGVVGTEGRGRERRRRRECEMTETRREGGKERKEAYTYSTGRKRG